MASPVWSSHGVEPREVRILVDAGRVAAHNIDVRDLRTLLEKQQLLGERRRDHRAWHSASACARIGEFRTLDEIRDLVHRRATSALARHRRHRAVCARSASWAGISISGRPSASTSSRRPRRTWSRSASGSLKAVDAARTLPQMQGISISSIGNQAESVTPSLERTAQRRADRRWCSPSLVLFFFLRDWPTTLIVTLAVPFSLLITLGAMYFLGLTLNMLSMMGMLLAIGMLVDNAVVVTESMFRHRQIDPDRPTRGDARAACATSASRRAAGTADTIIVFLPLVFGARARSRSSSRTSPLPSSVR